MAKVDTPKIMTEEEINNFKLKNNLSVSDSDKKMMHEWGKKKNENAEFYMNQSNKIKGPLKTKQNINDLTK